MKTGISLPFDYFTVTPQSGGALIMRRKIGEPTRFLAKLRDSTINCIELRGVTYSTPDDVIKNICRKLWQDGFSISIHTDLPENVTGENINSNFIFLKQIIGQIDNFQEKLILVAHSYSGKSCSYDDLLEKSARNINSLAKMLESEKLPVNLAIELNRGAIKAAPGTTYDGLLQLHRLVNSDKVGFCWDFGHAHSNAQKGTIPLLPPHDFVRKVIHTHIHGVDENDATHCPLNENNLPLVDYIRSLIENQYAGIYNLEINPKQLPEGNVLDIYVENANYIERILQFHPDSLS